MAYIVFLLILLFFLAIAITGVYLTQLHRIRRWTSKEILSGLSDEDGWDTDVSTTDIESFVGLGIALIFIGTSLFILSGAKMLTAIKQANGSANQTDSKQGCKTFIQEVINAKDKKGRFPELKELDDYLDAGLLHNTHTADSSTQATGYKAYHFIYLENDINSQKDETVRAVMAYPVHYKKGGTNVYYITTESSTIYQADAASVFDNVIEGKPTPHYKHVVHEKDMHKSFNPSE